jgi:Protein of unknown function (DUF1090)
MSVKTFFLAFALSATLPALAQPAVPPDSATCQAEEAALERDIDLARSRGQMLRRGELAEALGALQIQCKAAAPAESRAARIARLEQQARALRQELDRTEEQLRKLRSESP